jgi:hypothetical protein
MYVSRGTNLHVRSYKLQNIRDWDSSTWNIYDLDPGFWDPVKDKIALSKRG